MSAVPQSAAATQSAGPAFDPERCPAQLTRATYKTNFQGDVEGVYVFAPGSPPLSQGQPVLHVDPAFTNWCQSVGTTEAMAVIAAARDQFIAEGGRQRYAEIAARLVQTYEHLQAERKLASGYAEAAQEKIEDLAAHDEVMRWHLYAREAQAKIGTYEQQIAVLKRMLAEERAKVEKELYRVLQQAGARFRAEHMGKADAIEAPARAEFLPRYAAAHKERTIAGAISTDLLRMTTESVVLKEPPDPSQQAAPAIAVTPAIAAALDTLSV